MKKLIFLLLLFTSCSLSYAKSNDNRFAIYLSISPQSTKDKPMSKPLDVELNKITLEEKPIVTENDIVWYDSKSYEIKLSTNCFENISNIEVPTSGRIFVVCVGNKRIYWGAFWTFVSSQSFDGIVIIIDYLRMQKMKMKEYDSTIKLELGYPGRSAFKGKDRRYSLKIIERLMKINK